MKIHGREGLYEAKAEHAGSPVRAVAEGLQYRHY